MWQPFDVFQEKRLRSGHLATKQILSLLLFGSQNVHCLFFESQMSGTNEPNESQSEQSIANSHTRSI